jgi:hypothetical protein
MKLHHFPASVLTALSIMPIQVLSQTFLPPDEGGVIAEDGSVIHPVDWSESCDPWKNRPIDIETDYNSTLDVSDDWECPLEMRSMSGCGDFLHDTRDTVCEVMRDLPRCSDQRLVNAAQQLLPQGHTCFNHPIEEYVQYGNEEGLETPPLLGRHRERWAKWGEYEYIPPQRWLHNAEHGGAVFLYHPCISPEDLCKLRQYIWSRPDEELYGEDANMEDRVNAGKFRWILTPYPKLRTTMAIVAWGHVFMSECLNEPSMDKYLDMYYRQAWEDWAPAGPYDYLYVDDETRRDLSENHTNAGNGDADTPKNGTSSYCPRLSAVVAPDVADSPTLADGDSGSDEAEDEDSDDESSSIGGSVLSMMVVVVSLLAGITATSCSI